LPHQNLMPEACNLFVKYAMVRCKARIAVLVSRFKMLFLSPDGRIGAL